MSDAYQAVYDATRQQIGRCNTEQAIRDAASSAFSGLNMAAIMQDVGSVAIEMMRPSVLFRPTLREHPRSAESSRWSASYGENSPIGFGATPDEAMRDFDQRWAKP